MTTTKQAHRKLLYPGDIARIQDVKTYIITFNITNGVTPTVRQIAAGCHINSTGSVQRIMRHLETTGFIRRAPSRHSYALARQ